MALASRTRAKPGGPVVVVLGIPGAELGLCDRAEIRHRIAYRAQTHRAGGGSLHQSGCQAGSLLIGVVGHENGSFIRFSEWPALQRIG